MSTTNAAGQGSLLGKNFQYWSDRLGMSDAQANDMISNMLRDLSTVNAQNLNRSNETAAMYNLPVGTQLSNQNAISYNSALAGAQGSNQIRQYQDAANRNAWSAILGADFNETAGETDFGDYLMTAIGASGQAAGSYYGSKAGASTAAAAACDIRLKENIHKVGELQGFNVYTFNYIGEKRRAVGLMAQEVEKIMPEAVIEQDGYKHIDYAMVLDRINNEGK